LIAGGEAFANDALLDKKDLYDDDDDDDEHDGLFLFDKLWNSVNNWGCAYAYAMSLLAFVIQLFPAFAILSVVDIFRGVSFDPSLILLHVVVNRSSDLKHIRKINNHSHPLKNCHKI